MEILLNSWIVDEWSDWLLDLKIVVVDEVTGPNMDSFQVQELVYWWCLLDNR